MASLSLGDWRRESVVFVCSAKHLRKLFVVWWKRCVLAMITGDIWKALESFSFSAVYFWIHGSVSTAAQFSWVPKSNEWGVGSSENRRWLEKLIYGNGRASAWVSWRGSKHEIFSPAREMEETSSHGDEIFRGIKKIHAYFSIKKTFDDLQGNFGKFTQRRSSCGST